MSFEKRLADKNENYRRGQLLVMKKIWRQKNTSRDLKLKTCRTW